MSEKEILPLNEKTILLAGNPNVGKSVIFGLLTGKYVTVSNYPGTSVEITKGRSQTKGNKYTLLDSPGINSLIPFSEDEKVTRDILLELSDLKVIQVINSLHLSRALNLTIQFSEMDLPFIMDLNMDDEAKSRGIVIDRKKLKEIFNVEVISTVAVRRTGLEELKKAIPYIKKSRLQVDYGKIIEEGVSKIEKLLPVMNVARRFIAITLLCEDKTILPFLEKKMAKENLTKIENMVEALKVKFDKPLWQVIAQLRQEKVKEILHDVQSVEKNYTLSAEKENKFLSHPLFSTLWVILLALTAKITTDNYSVLTLPIWISLFAIILFAEKNFIKSVERSSIHLIYGWFFLFGILIFTYFFIGVFAAGDTVDFFENVIFANYVNPFITGLVDTVLPFRLAHEILVDETYGVLTVALTYSIAIILPIVTFFFMLFGVLEDSGYLPRLAVMVNKLFKMMGLNGKAVLPMVLGLGCDTMATITARILSTKKERLIVTLLLALGVPCSAQLGVILGMLAALSFKMVTFLILAIIGIIFIIGYLSSKILPGKSSDFIQELPPIRIPELKNIFFKTIARIEWYLKESVPVFMLGTFFLYLLEKFRLLSFIQKLAEPVVVNFLGLPIEATKAFIIGFLRRDYAATELFVLSKGNMLSPLQILVGLLTITLFVPCLANLLIIIKERGLKQAISIVAFIFPFAFLVGGLVNLFFRALGVH